LPGAFLLHNVSLANIGRALNGGVNDNQFPRWLDVRSSYAAFSALLAEWSAKVRRWRCGLSPANCAWLGVSSGWKCDDPNTFVDRVSFERLGPTRAAVLEAVATRLALPADQVDLLIEGGAVALRSSKTYQAFRSGL
jgi:NTE family protein